MLFNGFAQSLSPFTLNEISTSLDIRVMPAGYAFAIWGLIYTLLAVFTVYQALPKSMATSRNDDLIFNKIGYWYIVNMVFNGLWLVIFMRNQMWSFVLGCMVIIGLLATCVHILMLTLKNQTNLFEMFVMRVGFSIYSGWVTAATILNVTFCFKKGGVDISDENEEIWGVIILYVAFAVYVVASFNT